MQPKNNQQNTTKWPILRFTITTVARFAACQATRPECDYFHKPNSDRIYQGYKLILIAKQQHNVSNKTQ